MKRTQVERWHVGKQVMRKDAEEEPARHRVGVRRAQRAFGLLVLVLVPFASLSADDGKLYEVRDGNKVDEKTLNGWKTWRALACERCHGAQQEGLVGPPLTESLKKLTKEEFHTVMMEGRIEKGMPAFKTSEMVNTNWEGLYAYLKGRSDGAIQPGRLSAIE